MRVLLIISWLVMGAAVFLHLAKEGPSWASFGVMMLLVGMGFLFVFRKQLENWMSAYKERRISSSDCIVKDNCFVFPKGYYYQYGCLKNRRELPFEEVTEVRTNTSPITAVVDDKEVIFLRGLEKSVIEKLARHNLIRLNEPTDNWALMCEEFLDVEHSSAEREQILTRLTENGFDREEIRKIRKRLKTSMLLRTATSMEWIYYGQFDVLAELWPLTKKKYWWANEIALRTRL